MSESAAVGYWPDRVTGKPARRPRRSTAIVVYAGSPHTSDRSARALAASLGELGIEATYLGTETCPRRIAASVVDPRMDAIELCLARGHGVPLLRDLLRELISIGRRDVGIVVHRVD